MNIVMPRSSLLALIAWLPMACEGRQSNVQEFRSEDRAMNAAIDSARLTVGVFLARLAKPSGKESYVIVKKRFGTDAQGEHIWLDSVRFEAGRLHGRITDDAVRFPDVTAGQWTTVQPDSVSDWLIIIDGQVCGGFTLRVQRAELSPEERTQLDQSLAAVGLKAWRVTNAC